MGYTIEFREITPDLLAEVRYIMDGTGNPYSIAIWYKKKIKKEFTIKVDSPEEAKKELYKYLESKF